MSEKYLEIEARGATEWLTLNRPEQLNALNTGLMNELTAYFLALAKRPAVRVIVLQAAGRAFCAGMDLKERKGNAWAALQHAWTRQGELSQMILAMRRCPQPIVSIVQGAAAGGGFALLLASDVRLGTPEARMSAAFVRVGLSGCDAGVSYFLPRMVGSSVAAEYLLTGRFMDATRALALGLFSHVGTLDAMRVEASAIATDMLRASPIGLRMTKDTLSFSVDAQGLEAALALEDRTQVICAGTEDFAEAKAAFLEKREPRFQDR